MSNYAVPEHAQAPELVELDRPRPRAPSPEATEPRARPPTEAGPGAGFHDYSYTVQLDAIAPGPRDPETVHAVASQGVASGGGPLPFADRIAASFGAHDVSDVRAHVGGAAASANETLGSRAYATGKDIAFAGSPDLHTTAHEAAHVVQQRAGVALKGGVGEAGDPYEQHANAVADAVVAGKSAEPLLDQMAGRGGGASSAVQRQTVQFWDGHEHRAVGNLGAILATGNAEFRASELRRLRASFNPTRPGETFDTHTFSPGSIDLTGGDKQSTDPTLVGLEQRGRNVNRVRTNDRYRTDPESHQTEVIPSSISFGAANEFGGDFNKTPEALGREHADDDPVGNDFLVMVDVATSNINHFYPLNQAEYRTHHGAAVTLARQSYQALQAGQTGQADALMRQAVLKEGFACHFLADTFAAGHMAPRALDRISETRQGEDDLGLNRSKHWHDALNAINGSPGLPTSRGRFHGDDTMTGRELEIIGTDVGKSLREVITTASGRQEAANISLATPDVPAILATPDYGPIWRGMMGDYEQDLRAAERRGARGESMTSDGGVTTSTASIAGDMRQNVFGGEQVRLQRLAGSSWNGPTLNFTVTIEGRPAPAGTQVHVQFFDKDLGFDRSQSGHVTGTLASDAGAGLNDTDEKIGEPHLVTLTEGGLGVITSPVDDPGDVYAVIFATTSRLTQGATPAGQFVPTEVPIGRTETQGTRRGQVQLPMQVAGLSWNGATLRFRATRDGRPASGTVYVQFYDKDSAFDRDAGGNLEGTIIDTDEPIGGIHAVTVADGEGQLTATGDAVDPGDTYAVVYLDAARRTPLGRSPVMP